MKPRANPEGTPVGEIVDTAFGRLLRCSCEVSGAILAGERVGFMWRNEPDTENESGWVLWAEDEDDGDLSDPDHYAFCDLRVIADRDPSIVPVLDAPLDHVFGRDEAGSFVLIEFWGELD